MALVIASIPTRPALSTNDPFVTDDNDVVDTGIREFIRSNIQKSRLSAEGNVTDEDWIAFEAALLSRWEKIRTRVIRMRQSVPEADIGFEIFTDTTEEHREKLAATIRNKFT